MYQSFSRHGSLTVRGRAWAATSGTARDRSRATAQQLVERARLRAHRRHRQRFAERLDVREIAREHDARAGAASAMRVTIAVTFGLPSRSPPTHVPQRKNDGSRHVAAELRLELILDRAVNPRRDLEQRAAKHVERGLDLVERRRLVRARILGRVQREHFGLERDGRARGRVVEQRPIRIR